MRTTPTASLEVLLSLYNKIGPISSVQTKNCWTLVYRFSNRTCNYLENHNTNLEMINDILPNSIIFDSGLYQPERLVWSNDKGLFSPTNNSLWYTDDSVNDSKSGAWVYQALSTLSVLNRMRPYFKRNFSCADLIQDTENCGSIHLLKQPLKALYLDNEKAPNRCKTYLKATQREWWKHGPQTAT